MPKTHATPRKLEQWRHMQNTDAPGVLCGSTSIVRTAVQNNVSCPLCILVLKIEHPY